MIRQFRFVNAAAKAEFMSLPDTIRQQFGLDLYAVQKGELPFSRFKHVSETVGSGAIELIENGSPAYRAIYCAKFENTVFVLHAFTKTTNQVDRKEMATAKQRYKLMLVLIAER